MGHDNRACDCDSRFESATDVVGCKTSDPINPLHYMQGGVDIFNLDDSTAKSGGNSPFENLVEHCKRQIQMQG